MDSFRSQQMEKKQLSEARAPDVDRLARSLADTTYRAVDPMDDQMTSHQQYFGQDEPTRGVVVDRPLVRPIGAYDPISPMTHSRDIHESHSRLKSKDTTTTASSTVPTLTASSSAEEFVVESMPHFLEPTHVKAVVTSPSVVMRCLKSIVGRMETADCQAGRDNLAKLKVILWHVVYVAKVVITVFRDPKDDALVVEFQRRRGDSYVFNRFFREVLQQAHEVFGAGVRIPRGPMSTPMDLPLDEDESIGDEGLRPLIDMILSPYNDVSVDGARALVAAAQNEKSLSFIAGHGEICAVVEHLLNTKDAERACCGAHLLADVTKKAPTEAFAKLLAIAIRFFDEKSIEWHETHRQIARAAINYKKCASVLEMSCRSDLTQISLRTALEIQHFRGSQKADLNAVFDQMYLMAK